ncbi:unnamed protein product [Heligmosomoides polygyrus]|uniref:CCHC-type domain-containing protein n=1 Tax=Heligmosomoides polygyrus TaxID=6339 RepID=A0A3P8BXT2_HELPZ|nr:unnamed protein product [Heligmosomoides polygyrus]
MVVATIELLVLCVLWILNIRVDENDFLKAYVSVLLVILSGSSGAKFWTIVNSIIGVDISYGAYGVLSVFVANLYEALITATQLYVMMGTIAVALLLIVTAVQLKRFADKLDIRSCFWIILFVALAVGCLNYFLDPSYRGLPKFITVMIVIFSSALLVVFALTALTAVYLTRTTHSANGLAVTEARKRLIFGIVASAVALPPCWNSMAHFTVNFFTRDTTFADDAGAELVLRIGQFFTGLGLSISILLFRPYHLALYNFAIYSFGKRKKISTAPLITGPSPQLTSTEVCLLSTLAGEALTGFQFREEKYEVAVQWLKKKYAREEVAIEQLYRNVEEAHAKDATTSAQRKLLDDLSATMMQLTNKGQNVNHRWLLSTIFRKFDATVQEKALVKRAKLQSLDEWNWNKFQEHLEEIISRQKYIERLRQAINKEENPIRRKTNYKKEGPSSMSSKKECIYCCRTNHESYQCRTVPFEERLLFLTRNKLCHNCGKLNHLAKECKGPSCFKCGKKQHPSTCKGRQQQEETRRHMDNGSRPQPSAMNIRQRSPHSREATMARRENRPKAHPNRAMVNEIEEDERSETESDPEKREEVYVTGSHEGKKRTTLLRGMAKILGAEKDMDVRILQDTGSGVSFIDTQIIKDLNLLVLEKSKLKIKTFGQTTVEEIQYPVTQVLLEDKLGKIHELRLYGSKTIASKVKRPILSEDDWLIIKERGLDLTEQEAEKS